ncbi:MAG TPA: cytochrome D1 domain-containing protein [Gammaproteobacteria bacterium]|nr:cytochrome D1 domain-containing protein [Gammaproteobacteria bacterium]
MKNIPIKILISLSVFTVVSAYPVTPTTNRGIIIERATGSIKLVDTARRIHLADVDGMGDLSHASAVFSRDEQHAYVFGRDGGLTKIDLHTCKIEKRIRQAGNSIGGAISRDGKFVAASNYEPGGIRIFKADTLEPVVDIPAVYGDEENPEYSRVVGLVDAPGQRFIASLYDAGEIWVIDLDDTWQPEIRKFTNVGLQPYDALITPDGRYYIAGLYGENGLAVLDLYYLDRGVRRVLQHYGRDEEELPVYKMPHLEGWAVAGNYLFIPAVGHHAIHVINKNNWEEVTRISTHGQPVFAIARPDGRQVWVNFAFPDNNYVEIIDVEKLAVVKKLEPGKAVLHMEFTKEGDEVWISVRDEDRVNIYNTMTFDNIGLVEADKPSGIFFSSRAHKIGL